MALPLSVAPWGLSPFLLEESLSLIRTSYNFHHLLEDPISEYITLGVKGSKRELATP